MDAPPQAHPPEEVLERLYQLFNAREIEPVLEMMTPDVDWPNGFEGGRVSGRDAVRDYWRRQFEQVDPNVEPTEFTERDDGRVAVTVHQIVRSPDGELISDGFVEHIYTFRDGLIAAMEIAELG